VEISLESGRAGFAEHGVLKKWIAKCKKVTQNETGENRCFVATA
jgi:hypothetical protein